MKAFIVLLTGVVAGTATAALASDHSAKMRRVEATAPTVVSPGKQRAAIDVSHRLNSKPAVGEPLELQLVFASRTATQFEIEVEAPAALALGSGPLRRRVAAGSPLVIELLPHSEGRHYVNVIAREPGRTAAPRVVSIPIQVGTTARRAAKAERSASGELLIRMRAD